MRALIQLFRPHHWVKNVFIFTPIFFDHQATNFEAFLYAFYSFVGFSLIASSIYCFNDIIDVNSDKSHPEKCKRPIASGKVSVSRASISAIILLTLGLVIMYIGNDNVYPFYIAIAYVIANILYTLKFKEISIIDVFIIGFGFVFRVLIGGASTDIELSHWIIIMTFLISLFLGFAKRRDDVILYLNHGVKMRKNINLYNKEFLDSALMITSTITIVAYIMYTISDETIENIGSEYTYTTAIFVILGFFRYLQITLVKEDSGSPTKIIFKDRFIQISILCWITVFFFIIYF